MTGSDAHLTTENIETAKAIQGRLARSKRVKSIGASGQSELLAAERRFTERTAIEAIYQAERLGDDSVSDKHVKRAVETDSTARKGLAVALQPVGGLFAGAGLSLALTVIRTETERTTLSLTLMIVFLILGVAILSVSIQQIRRR